MAPNNQEQDRVLTNTLKQYRLCGSILHIRK